MQIYVVDAHALAWFVSEDKRLSAQVNYILEQAEGATIQVLIPTITG
jgi:PIN domain nuclease of toxin-antitoxin system